MRLYDFDRTKSDNKLRLSCRVSWESTDRADATIEFLVDGDPGFPLSPNPDAFLLAASIPAAAAGEERILVDGQVCGMLLDSIPSALAILKNWFPEYFPAARLPAIEVQAIAELARGTVAGNSVGFYSGGVDSTSMLLANAQRFPPGHCARIAHAICVHGFDIGGRRGEDGTAAFELLKEKARPFLTSLDVGMLAVHTNLRHLDDRPGFWGKVFVGFALSAVAHVFGAGFRKTYVATQGEPLVETVQAPFGNHRIVMDYAGAGYVELVMPYIEVSRLGRLRSIAQSEQALNSLRVCYFADHGRGLNCGRCEKCIRTQLGLMLCGVDPTPYFSSMAITPSLLDNTDIASVPAQLMYLELRDGMHALGRLDLRNAIDRQLDRFDRYLRWRQGRTLGGRMRKLLSGWKDG